MLTLSPTLINEKNKLESEGAWILIVNLISPNQEYNLKFARNTEDIIYQGDTYQAFPFELSEVKEDSKGKITEASLKISNIDRIAQGYIEQDETFGSNWDVYVSVVNTEYLDSEDFSPLTYKFKSKSVTCNKEFAIFTIGVPNAINIQTPHQKYSPVSCQRTFNDGRGCPYTEKGGFVNQRLDLGNAIDFIDSYENTLKDGTTFKVGSDSEGYIPKDDLANIFLGTDEDDPLKNAWKAFANSRYLWISDALEVGESVDYYFSFNIPRKVTKLVFGGYHVYYIQRIQAYDESINTWVDLPFVQTKEDDPDVYSFDKYIYDIENYTSYKLYRLGWTRGEYDIIFNGEYRATLNMGRIYTTSTPHTFCNATLANCKERYPKGLTNDKGEKIGLPFNGKLGMTQQAIYS